MPASMSFSTSFLTTSCMFRFSLYWASRIDLASSSRIILCIHMVGLIPLMSSMIQSIAFFRCPNSFTTLFSWACVSVDDMMNGYVFPSPKKMYFRCFGSSFSSGEGKTDGSSWARLLAPNYQLLTIFLQNLSTVEALMNLLDLLSHVILYYFHGECSL